MIGFITGAPLLRSPQGSTRTKTNISRRIQPRCTMVKINPVPKLSETTIDTMRTNLPLFEEHSTEIVLGFYDTMFRDYPSVKKQFNMDRQKGGSSVLNGVPAQISALADFVLRFVKNISDVEKMQPAIERVAHKHISRGVTPEQYVAMSTSFIKAVHNILEPDEAMMTAWKELFDHLNTRFINTEDRVGEMLTKRAGYSGFVECDVVKVSKMENSKIGVWILPREVGLPEYRRGQFVGVIVEGKTGEMMCTSILAEPQSGEEEQGMCLVVKESNEAASRFLREAKVGDCLRVSVPCGKGF